MIVCYICTCICSTRKANKMAHSDWHIFPSQHVGLHDTNGFPFKLLVIDVVGEIEKKVSKVFRMYSAVPGMTGSDLVTRS